jgi:hypothetical protein
MLAAFIVFCLNATSVHAQYGTLPIGQITNVQAEGCPTSQWYPGTQCYSATISCPNVSTINLTFGYVNPSTTPSNGTIVFFNGSDGTAPAGDATGSVPGETTFVTDYLAAGYQIVQIAWANPWQQALIPYPNGPSVGNIQAASCRSATFLNYVFNSPTLYQGVHSAKPSAGMCAQGASAGSAQIVYPLAYYAPPAGSQWWTDKVVLISGPVLSDIKQGCEVPGPPTLTTICPAGQWGCQLGTGGSSWTLSATYLAGTNSGVGSWTDDPTCANNAGQQTTAQSNAQWLAQSIVDQAPGGSSGAVPVYQYSNTAMSGWLCRSVANAHSQQLCSTDYLHNDFYCPNNSSPQGEIFYNQINALNSPPAYNVYAVDSCNGPEGASSTGATVLALQIPNGQGQTVSQDGYDAIKYDMIGGGPLKQPVGCAHPSGQ